MTAVLAINLSPEIIERVGRGIPHKVKRIVKQSVIRREWTEFVRVKVEDRVIYLYVGSDVRDAEGLKDAVHEAIANHLPHEFESEIEVEIEEVYEDQ